MATSPPDTGLYASLVRRPVATVMAFVAALVFGAVSYTNLPLNLMPDLDYPTLTVRTEFPGAAPGEVETYVSRVLEESLSTVPGLLGFVRLPSSMESSMLFWRSIVKILDPSYTPCS